MNKNSHLWVCRKIPIVSDEKYGPAGWVPAPCRNLASCEKGWEMASQPVAATLARWPQLSHWVSSASDKEQPIAHSRQPRRSGAQRKIAGSTVMSRCGLAIGPGGRVSQGIIFEAGFGAGQVAAGFAQGKALRLETARRPWLVCSQPIP